MSPSSLVNTLSNGVAANASRQKRVRIIAGQRLARTGIRMAKIAVHVFVALGDKRVVARHAGEIHTRQMIDLLLRQLAEEQFGQHAVIGCSPRIHLDELGNQLVALRLRLRLRRLRRCLVFDHLATFLEQRRRLPPRHRFLAPSLSFRLASRTG